MPAVIALVILPEASRFLAEYRGVVYGLILIGVILFRPEGVAGVPGITAAMLAAMANVCRPIANGALNACSSRSSLDTRA